MSRPSSKYPTKSSATTSPMDAHTYLTQLTAKQSNRSPPSRSGSSIISYADSDSTRTRSYSGSTASDDSSYSSDDEPQRPSGWRGMNSAMPLPSYISAQRQPTVAVDRDFIPNPSDPYSLRHSEYGHDDNPDHRATSQYDGKTSLKASDEEPALSVYLLTYLAYAALILVGHVRDFFGKWLMPNEFAHLRPSNGYAPLYSDFDSFYTRRLKLRLEDCFARPVTSIAARTITLLDRTTDDDFNSFTFTGETSQVLNVSSYNYLGFTQSRGPCADQAESIVRKYGVSTGGGRLDVGTNDLLIQAERLVASFLGVEDAMIVPMGFATNSTNLPALLSKGCLVISDELNHSSIRFGARMSGAMIRQYKHNDMEDFEHLLRECISQGQPRTHRPWKKILVIVEGLYSMEGTLVDLPRLLELKERYKFYLYVDEAHSIGALGPRGRGVCDYFGVDPRKVDILMGTFTKSFGAAGGYIGGSHELIQSLRLVSHSTNYGETMSPPVVAQIVTSMGSIMGNEAMSYVPALSSLPPSVMDGTEGRDRLRRLAFNCRYLSSGLKRLGFIVYGHHDSPIVPLLLYQPTKMPAFSRLMLERHRIAVVVVAYPATPIVSGRVRFCLSAAHTKEDLDRILRATDEVGTILGLKISPSGRRERVEDVIATGVEWVRRSEQGSPLPTSQLAIEAK